MLHYWTLRVKNFFIEVRVFDETGQTLIEYGLLLLLIAIIVVGVLTLVGGEVGALYQRVIDEWPYP